MINDDSEVFLYRYLFLLLSRSLLSSNIKSCYSRLWKLSFAIRQSRLKDCATALFISSTVNRDSIWYGTNNDNTVSLLLIVDWTYILAWIFFCYSAPVCWFGHKNNQIDRPRTDGRLCMHSVYVHDWFDIGRICWQTVLLHSGLHCGIVLPCCVGLVIKITK